MTVQRKAQPTTTTAKKATRLGAPKVATVAPDGLSLPEEPSTPSTNLADYAMLIYGEKKIGKTSLASHFPDAMFMMFEAGGKSLEIYQRPCNTWAEFVAYLDLLDNTDRFGTVVIDTVDLAYAACFDHMCAKLLITHPHDENDYGKSWGLIEKEYQKQIGRLMSGDRGVIFLSHAQVNEISSRAGVVFSRIEPSMPKQAARFLEAVVDIWAYYGYWGEERRLLLRGNETIGAGTRLEHRFVAKNGDPVQSIPMGGSSGEAFHNFLRAFDNKQPTSGAELKGEARTTNAKVRHSKA